METRGLSRSGGNASRTQQKLTKAIQERDFGVSLFCGFGPSFSAFVA
jgi:hypothetical protein